MNNKLFRTCFIRCVLVSSTLSNLFAQNIDPTQHVWIDEKAAEIAIVKYNALQDTLKYHDYE